MTTNKKPKKHVLHKDGYKFEFWLEGKGRAAEVLCNAYKVTRPQPAVLVKEELVLEWAFPKVPGNNILGNAAIYLDQALLYAKNPPNQEKVVISTEPLKWPEEQEPCTCGHGECTGCLTRQTVAEFNKSGGRCWMHTTPIDCCFVCNLIERLKKRKAGETVPPPPAGYRG